MPKTSSVYTRVEPELKEKAEQVLSNLGIPVANAINMFLHQVVLHNGIPFDVKIPHRMPLNYSELSTVQFNAEVQKGIDDLNAGRTTSSKKVREEMQRLYTK
jgi:addiction module RelB/DinJ family antitoxin